MADQFKIESRSNDPWCRHDNNRTADCKPCWMKVKRQHCRRARSRVKRDSQRAFWAYLST